MSVKPKLLLVVLCAVLGIPGFAQKPLKLNYVFIPDAGSPATILHVGLTFQGNATGNSRLILPTEFAGQRDLFSSIRGLKAIDPETEILPSNEVGVRNLRYPPNRLIEISYSIVTKSAASAPSQEGSTSPPEIAARPTEFIFNGQNGLIHPELIQTSPVQVSFRWKDLPAAWIVATSFGIDRDPDPSHPSREVHPDQLFTGEWGKVFNAVFSAGEFRLTHLSGNGENLTLATNGSWVFTDREAAEEVLDIFRAERHFWGDTRPENFLVILTPPDAGAATSDGTVFTGAFLLHLSRKQTFQIEEKSLLAHEIFHIWNPYSMGFPSGEATEWFTEGFTHYYQDRILLQAGVLSYPDYLKRLNQIVADYWSSPDRNWAQHRWMQRTSTGDAEYALPYKQGAVLALWLDERLRATSGGRVTLDNRLFDLVDGQEKLLTTGYLITALTEGLPKTDVENVRTFLIDGTTIPLPMVLAPDCATLVETGGADPHYKPAGGGGCENQLHARRSPASTSTR